jgi:EF-P beta-lysylation protein EpmB
MRALHDNETDSRVNCSEPRRPETWQRLLADAIRDGAELCRMLELPETLAAPCERFPMLVPRGFAALMRKGDPADPLLRQVLSVADEYAVAPDFTADPLQESGCSPKPGLLHKYHGRALLVCTGACAVHCRYCFRRNYPYDEVPRGRSWWSEALDYFSGDASLHELILSGGDPLTLSDAVLSRLTLDFAQIPHLTRLRIHSRLPVVLPQRVTDAMLGWFATTRLQPVMVMHANHPREISLEVVDACARMRAAGVRLFNQSVLLSGVNDDVATLAELSETLFAAGVQPYYLHALDRVQGAAHFLVSDQRMRDIIDGLAARLPGYLVPKLVREDPGAPAKTAVFDA